MRLEVSYEGQAAIELEAAADPGDHGRYELPIDGLVLDPRPLVLEAAADLRAGVAPGIVAARFHDAVASATAARLRRGGRRRAGSSSRCSPAACSEPAAAGGDGGAAARRRACACSCPSGCRPATAAISYGQASVAAAQSAQSPTIGKWENRAR